MRKKLLIGLAVLAGVFVTFLGVAAMQPDEMRVQRSLTINAAPEDVFVQVNNLHHWEDWSPWAKLDPEMQETFEGPVAGEGASNSWVGNDEVGEGKMTIVESKPGELVTIKLEFVKPYEATNDVHFTFEPVDGQTKVTWSMQARQNFVCKCFGLFLDMEQMIGQDFDKGLTSLKTVTEKYKQLQVAEAQKSEQ